jgi:steroid delta-isomerase-like uncharacterized protein
MSDIRELTEQGWDAWFRHDIDALMAFYSDDSELVLPGSPPIKGKDAIRAAWEGYTAAFPDERPLQIRHLVDGNTAITEWTTIATNTGPMLMPNGETLPPTGKSVTLRGMTIADIAGDKVKRQAFYWDNAEFMQQMGLMPAPEAAPV